MLEQKAWAQRLTMNIHTYSTHQSGNEPNNTENLMRGTSYKPNQFQLMKWRLSVRGHKKRLKIGVLTEWLKILFVRNWWKFVANETKSKETASKSIEAPPTYIITVLMLQKCNYGAQYNVKSISSYGALSLSQDCSTTTPVWPWYNGTS